MKATICSFVMKLIFLLSVFGMGRLLAATALPPSADAFVHSGESDTNFGSNTSLSIKSSEANATTARLGYLRFNLAELGTAPVEDAILKLTVITNNAGAGSPTSAEFTVEVWGLREDADNWTEDGITWLNAPARVENTFNSSAILLGTIDVSASVPPYSISFSAAALVDFLNDDRDQMATLMVRGTSGGASNLAFASKEYGTPDFSPALILTPRFQGPGLITELSRNEEVARYQFEYKNYLKKSGCNPAIYASDDLIHWIRLNSPVVAKNGGLSAEIEVSPSAPQLFFRIDEDRFRSLSPQELDVEASRLSAALNGLGEIAIDLWNANPALSEEISGAEALSPLLELLEQLMDSFTPEERKAFLEASFATGLADELQAFLAEADSADFVESRMAKNVFLDFQWKRVAEARLYKKYEAVIKPVSFTVGALSLLGGPMGMIVGESITFLLDALMTIQSMTPTKLTGVTIVPDRDLMKITLHEESFPHLRFEGDFEADQSSFSALADHVIGELGSKAIRTMVKVNPKFPKGLKELEAELLARRLTFRETTVFDKFVSLITKLLSSNPAKFSNVPFPIDYFPHETYCYAGLEHRPSLIWNRSLGRLDADIGGEGSMEFIFRDPLYAAGRANVTLSFKVTDLPPEILRMGPAELNVNSGELHIPLVINDERKEKLLLELESAHGSVSWRDGMMIYRLPGLSITGGGERWVTSEAVESATAAAQFSYLDDEIKIKYSDHYNPENRDSFRVDLRTLFPMIRLEIDNPPAGMMQVFQVSNTAHPTGSGVAKRIDMKLSEDYLGDMIVLKLKAELGTSSASGQMTLRTGRTFYYPPENFLGLWHMKFDDDDPGVTIDVRPDGTAHYNHPDGWFWRWRINQSSATIYMDHSYWNLPLVFYIPKAPALQNRMEGKGRLIAPPKATLSR